MRTFLVGLIIALVALLAPSAARATSGTCTITRMLQTNPYPLGVDFGMPVAEGFAIPVEFDEAAGTFSMDRDAWRAQFPGLGAEFNTIGGVSGFFQMNPGVAAGTIDGSGRISIPDFGVTNSTDFVDPPPVLPVEELDVSTGAVVRSISVVSRASLGVPLDFATGEVVLAGIGFILSAPGSPGTNMAGVRIACTLSPVPSQASLPPGATLTKLKGRVRLDPKPFANGARADQLTAKATLVPGPAPLVLDGSQPLVVGVSVGGTEVATLYVAGGAFQRRGKRLVATRDDTCKVKKGAAEGVCRADRARSCESFADCAPSPAIQVLAGRKTAGQDRAQLGGTIAVVPAKNGAAVVSVKLQGLDLAAVTGATDVSVAVGEASAGATVQATGGKLK